MKDARDGDAAAAAFQRIREVFEATLERPPEEREDFLDKSCGGDALLRHEVQRMLAQVSSPAFVDQPAWEGFAELLDEDAEPAIGSQLGPYRLESVLGTGGMGRVYRATDTRLSRSVALKISRREFSRHFEREARLVAALNHPNICCLYDVGPNYLVMELVAGPTLAERIQDGPIPLPEALRIAREIAAALEAAHKKRIVHGDLKPRNIMLTESGHVKVLDFGLARIGDPGSVEGNPRISEGMSSVQLGAKALAGTPAYMSPEQARGGTGDQRADIWAFGAVLFEMLTGAPPFKGRTSPETLASVARDKAPMDLVPQQLRALLDGCLEKDPRKRLPEIDAVGRLLDHGRANIARKRRWLWALPAMILAGVAVVWFWQTNPDPPLLRMEISAPDGVTFGPAAGVGPTNRSLALAPDGSALVFEAYSKDQSPRIWVRLLNSDRTYPLSGADGVGSFFWSHDARWLGFFARGKLQKIRVRGGEPQVICPLENFAGGTWNSNSTILLGNARGPILRVSADGGMPVPALKLAATETFQTSPEFLPDGRHFLFVSRDNSGNHRLMLASLDGKAPKPVLDSVGTLPPHYAPNPRGGNGWILYVERGHRVARSFDPIAGEFTGKSRAIPQVDDVIGGITWSPSANGMLAFRRGRMSQLTWFDREGKLVGIAAEPGLDSHFPRISPNQKSIIFFRDETFNTDIWRLDVSRGIPERLTAEPADAHFANVSPVWSADGASVLYMSQHDGLNLIVERSVGSSGPDRSIRNAVRIDPSSVSRDGRWLGVTIVKQGKRDIALMSLANGNVVPVSNPVAADRANGAISPDGRWLAYTYGFNGVNGPAVATTVPEVHVRSLPTEAGGVTIPVDLNISGPGAANPVWNSNGKEIIFLAADGKLMVVAVEGDANSLHPGVPRTLFQTRLRPDTARNFDITADGQRFLMNLPMEPPITVIVNWPQLLRK